MKAAKIAFQVLMAALISIAPVKSSLAGPTVAFQSASMSILGSTTLRTPTITIINATGVTSVDLSIYIPPEISISSTLVAGNLGCVTKGSSVGSMFFSEWNAATRRISISCDVTPSANLEIVRWIQFSVPDIARGCQITISGTLTGGSGTSQFGSISLVPPHLVSITDCSAIPSALASGGSTKCQVLASCNLDHNLRYEWSDGNCGGSFSPSALVSTPTYTAQNNTSGSNRDVILRCRVTCSASSAITAIRTASVTVATRPNANIQVTSSPNPNAPIAFSPSPDSSSKASPGLAPFTLSYLDNLEAVQLTAARQDTAAHALWFDHWVLDGAIQTQGELSLTLNMNGQAHTAIAVYQKAVGDLNNDGSVGKPDAQLLMSAILGDIAITSEMDTDLSGEVNLRDSLWILAHSY